VGAGAGAARNEALGLEVAQRAADGRTGNAKSLHQVCFTGQALARPIFPGVNLRRELAGYGTVFETFGHGKSASSRFKADTTTFFESVTSAADARGGVLCMVFAMVIGLDLGTTSLSAVLFEPERQVVIGSAECPNRAAVTGLAEGYHEQCAATVSAA